jgi:rSAM/selenodomain-associated transferase 2
MSYFNTTQPDISIIIPVLHEGQRIQSCLAHLTRIGEGTNIEIIVVDGDPQGSTLSLLPKDYSFLLKGLVSPPGRGTQMNQGVRIAQGRILLFLHADTELPHQALEQICSVCDHDVAVGGAFDLAIASPRLTLKLIGKVASWRSRLTRIPYGDQAIFVKRAIFDKVQGYPDIPIMEDIALMQRLKQHHYPIKILQDSVLTSPRRWEKEGILRCTLRNWSLVTLYFLGFSPKKFVKWYQITLHEKTMSNYD